MILRLLGWLALAALALAVLAGLQREGSFLGRLLRPEPPPRPIVFDNGTVRSHGAASQPGAAARPQARLAPGALRRCSRGSETAYTDRACPPGFTEGTVSRGTVNVLSGGGAPRPAAQDTPRPPARSTLHDVLDLGADPRLRERTMERALE